MEHDFLALAARIEAFELDDPQVVDTLSQRLARENGWSEAYSQRVVREYKRFLALALVTDHVVTPSDQVDQAWHLHLLDSARYRRFCVDVLGRHFDHEPSAGGRAERARFVRAYEQTLSSYAQRFGESPPRDVWPEAERRFGADLAVRRVNTAEHWVLRKPRVWHWLRTRLRAPRGATGRALLVAGTLSGLVCGCGASLSNTASRPDYLVGLLASWLAFAAATYFVKKRDALKTISNVPVLQPYQLAQLAGGPGMALDSAITSLIARGTVELDSARSVLIAKRPPPKTAPALEHAAYGQIAVTGELDIGKLRRQANHLTQPFAEQLRALGLVTSRRSKLPLLFALAAPLAGFAGVVNRFGTHEPIGWLLFLTLLTAVAAFWFFRPRQERTPLGDAVLAQAREAHDPLQQRESAATLAENGMLPVVFSLFGASAIVGLSAWTESLRRQEASYSSGGCSFSVSSEFGGCGGDSASGCSGDGGGGCGGGCGGGD